MNFLEQMMKETERLLKESQRQERALERIFKVLQLAEKQRENTKEVVMLMLDYEQYEQRMRLEQKGMSHRIGNNQKKEFERDLQLYEEYIVLLTKGK